MNGSGQIIDCVSVNAQRSARRDVWSRAGQFLKALLVAVILFAGAPISAFDANAHFVDSKSQAAVTSISVGGIGAQGGESGSSPFSAIEHHFCCSSSVEAFSNRASYVIAYLAETRVRYPAYLEALGVTSDPDPLRKPPRFSFGA